jgi:ABC-type cobalamin transport system ATPase subunit
MTVRAIHTSDARRADKVWLLLGGRIFAIRGTGEKLYVHEVFDRSLRTNGRRNDVPAKLLTRINQVLHMKAANDDVWNAL